MTTDTEVLEAQRAAIEAAKEKVIQAPKPMPPSTWLIRFKTKTPIGWLFFAPGNGLPSFDPIAAAAGQVTDWHNDPNQAIHFRTARQAQSILDYCAQVANYWQDPMAETLDGGITFIRPKSDDPEAALANAEIVECEHHPYDLSASGPPE